MAEKADIYQLISYHCTSEQISTFLRQYRQAGAAEVLTSGTKEALVQHLKAAVQERHIPINDVLQFLREAEENGNQHIFLFFPNSKKIKDLCNDFEKITELLFGKDFGKMHFPLYDSIPTIDGEYIWSDFRDLSPDRVGWIGKLYGLEHELVFLNEDRPSPGKVVKNYEEIEQRNVCLVRWDKNGILQIRVPRGESDVAPDERVRTVWQMLRPALQAEDFARWETTKIRRRIAEERKKHAKVYYLPTLQILDSRSGTATFACYAESDLEPAPEERDAAISLYLGKEEISCKRLVVIWLADGSSGHLDRDLRVILGSRHPHELIIQPRVSSEAVEYVTNKLREFNR